MSRSKTRLDLDLMKEKDLINLMLFGLYRLKDDPMYASLCDLIFVFCYILFEISSSRDAFKNK